MKTRIEVAEIANYNSLDELIFANRNRSYGAYELRKKYKHRLFIGFILGFFIFGTAISVPLIQNYLGKNKPQESIKDNGPIVLTDIDIDEITPPPPPPPIDEDIIKKSRFIAPEVVEKAPENDIIKTNDENITIDNENIDLSPAPKDNSTDVFDGEDMKPEIIVDEDAMFEGGDINAFRAWVQHSIIYPQLALESEIEGKVFLQFVVNTKGEVTNIAILKGPHSIINDEAARVIASSPKWKPARINGRNVKQLFSLPVIFKISR